MRYISYHIRRHNKTPKGRIIDRTFEKKKLYSEEGTCMTLQEYKNRKCKIQIFPAAYDEIQLKWISSGRIIDARISQNMTQKELSGKNRNQPD